MNFFNILYLYNYYYFFVGREKNALTKIREQHKVEDNIWRIIDYSSPNKKNPGI